jgi:hypothetical protein
MHYLFESIRAQPSLALANIMAGLARHAVLGIRAGTKSLDCNTFSAIYHSLLITYGAI